MKKIFSFAVLAFLVLPNLTSAHPGNTDASGCHTCRTNCAKWGLSTGEYHCHRSKGVAQPIEPVRSIKNENGVGTTVAAPEYKQPAATVKTATQNKTATQLVASTPNAKPVVKEQRVEKRSWIFRFINWVF